MPDTSGTDRDHRLQRTQRSTGAKAFKVSSVEGIQSGHWRQQLGGSSWWFPVTPLYQKDEPAVANKAWRPPPQTLLSRRSFHEKISAGDREPQGEANLWPDLCPLPRRT